MDTGSPDEDPGAIARWLLFVAGMVFLMVVIGGITRLTESGMSITEWKPVTGVLPPMSDQAWEAEFRKYRKIPEYRELREAAGMNLADFKAIYFWEWLHRLFGRLTGLAYALPLAWFAFFRGIPRGFAVRLLGILGLGTLQAIGGWWMVSSGLSERVGVSHHRLAVHLMLALLIFACLQWTALDLRLRKREPQVKARLSGFSAVVLAALAIVLVLGAYTAGLNAGHVSKTWPLMYGRLFPPGIEWSLETLRVLPNHPILVHFLHRWWAWVVVIALTLLARRIRRRHRLASIALHCAFGTQILLGIATVLMRVPISLAVLHQAVAVGVLAATVWGAHLEGRKPASVTLE